ncbi:hypothetical protein SRB5_47010 [Streptomyces sp. RB5]|uniref:Alpha-N-acetylglucosaminidase n=1 Tax=Streptomyces smaragdinus TaxID=2585196 RepID=A0A7K0CMN5_9ACTN|nr:alpha-N-acetylglucosaminidase TIM-barrel domain-containing protein [Streptomyces smaragdinus]MQY14533.1 hypothetical protein [Streptomyces smaragdinus]
MPGGPQPSRRAFLTAAGAAAATVALPAVPAAAVTLGAAVAAGVLAAADSPGTEAARSAIRRLAPRLADRFVLRLAPDAGPYAAAFSFRTADGAVELTGSDTSALLAGFTWYLEQHAHGQLSRGGDQVPARLVLPAAPVTRTTSLAHRYAYGFRVTGCTNPHWSWAQWERELDLLAASGVNELLVTTGMEVLWYDTWRQFGCTGAEALAYISLPSRQPWQWTGHLFGAGGGMSTQLLARRVELGRRILTRLGELGITPVAPGFAGSVPNGFAARHPGVRVVGQGTWRGYDRPDWLDPTAPLFQEVASVWYAAQRERFGLLRSQAIDLLYEGGRPGAVDLTEAGLAIERSLKTSVPDHRWYVQASGADPRRELLDAVDRSRVLVLELDGELRPGDNRFEDTAWAWGQRTNYGGRTGLYGPLAPTAALPALGAGPAGAGGLRGTCLVNEGVDTNPVWGTLFAEAHWHTDPIDLDSWITAYPLRRYGRPSQAAASAWRTLHRTAYTTDTGGGGADSLFNAQPDLTARRAAPDAAETLGYHPDALHPALLDLLRAAAEVGDADTYRWDLVNVTRQALVDRARVLLPRLRTAYETRDLAAFDQLTAGWLTLMDALEELLGTRAEFLAGRWIADARRWGADDAERDVLESDARTVLTTWGETRAAAVSREYANRDWAGLVGGYYKPRWRRYFTALRTALTSRSTPETIDWYAFAEAFRRDRTPLPATPTGDPLHAARAAATLLHPRPQLTAALLPGPVLRATLVNWRPTPLDAAPELDLPDGWHAEAAQPDGAPPVGGYDRATYTWRLTAPEDTAGAVLTVRAGGVRADVDA